MEKAAVSIKNLRVDAAKIKGVGRKILKAVGWFFLLYIITVVCVHISSFPIGAYRFFNTTWAKALDGGTDSYFAVVEHNIMYFLLFLSGLIIFFCKKKSLDRMEKAVKIRKFPLFASVFFAMPFSYRLLDFIVAMCRPINIFHHLWWLLSDVVHRYEWVNNPSTLLGFYIFKIPSYWSDPFSYGYMLAIFCTYYIIKQLYLYYRQTQIYYPSAK